MKLKTALNNWRRFHQKEFVRMLTAPNRKSLLRQALEAGLLFWRYRHPPVQYLRYALYLKTAPADWHSRLPYAFFRDLQSRFNPREAQKFAKNKRLFRERMEAAGLPAVREIFTIDLEGAIRGAEGQPLAAEDAAALIRAGEFFVKPIDGLQGRGTSLIRPGDDVEAFVATARNVIVQPRVRQHSLLRRLAPNSVNTVRIDTLPNGDRWLNNAAVLKVGIGENIVDNGSAGGISIGIDLATGRLHPVGHQKPKYGSKMFDRHPDTGVVFQDVVLPNWDLLRETVSRAADAMLPLRSLGWDVAITEEGVVLLETNHSWDPDLFEIAWGGLADTVVGQMACEMQGVKLRRSFRQADRAAG